MTHDGPGRTPKMAKWVAMQRCKPAETPGSRRGSCFQQFFQFAHFSPLIMQYLHHELHVCLLTNPTSSASSTFGSLLMQTVVCKRRCMTPRLSPSLPPADDAHESQAHQTNCATHNHGEQRKRRVLRVVMIAVRSVFTAFVDDLDDSQHLVVRRASGARIMFTKNLRMHTIWPHKSDAPQPTSLREHPAL